MGGNSGGDGDTKGESDLPAVTSRRCMPSSLDLKPRKTFEKLNGPLGQSREDKIIFKGSVTANYTAQLTDIVKFNF